MTDHQEWKWYSGENEEEFSGGPFDTRDEAVAALDGYGGFVVLARKMPLQLSKHFDVGAFLEGAEDDVSDLCNENGDPIFDISKAQADDLQARVRAAIDAWQNEHGLTFVPWFFSGHKHLEHIPGDHGED